MLINSYPSTLIISSFKHYPQMCLLYIPTRHPNQNHPNIQYSATQPHHRNKTPPIASCIKGNNSRRNPAIFKRGAFAPSGC